MVANVTTRVLIRGRWAGGCSESEKENVMTEQRSEKGGNMSMLLVLKMEDGATDMECRRPLEAERTRRQIRLQKEPSPAHPF